MPVKIALAAGRGAFIPVQLGYGRLARVVKTHIYPSVQALPHLCEFSTNDSSAGVGLANTFWQREQVDTIRPLGMT